MSGPSMLEPHGTDLYDRDPAWMHWKRCTRCDEPVNPDESMTLHRDVYHAICADFERMEECDCEGHDD